MGLPLPHVGNGRHVMDDVPERRSLDEEDSGHLANGAAKRRANCEWISALLLATRHSLFAARAKSRSDNGNPEVAPFNKLIGVKVLLRSPSEPRHALTVREELCNRRGVLHGGAVMALGDTLGGMTASSSLKPGAAQPPSRARQISLHRCRKAFGACRMHAIAPRRTTVVLETRIKRGDGKLAAVITQTQLLFDQRNGE